MGYTLDEITNDITGVTKASFEPTIDYVVVKIPRFAFQKFRGADPTLTTQMKSVGEVMAIGRTFKEALHKVIRSLEVDRYGLVSVHGLDHGLPSVETRAEIQSKITNALRTPRPDRLWHLADGIRLGMSLDDIYALTHIDYWFLDQIREIIELEQRLSQVKSPGQQNQRLDADLLCEAKQLGFSDHRIAQLTGYDLTQIASWRKAPDETARRQSLRAGQIIRHLREFVTRGETEKAPEDIRKLVEEAGALALVGSRERGVRSVFDFGPGADLVMVDRVQIQQVLTNLMRNAMEAMRDCDRRESCGADRLGRRRPGGRRGLRYRAGHFRGSRSPPLQALRHHQARRHGGGTVDLKAYCGSASRRDIGEPKPERRRHFPLHAACARR